VKFLPKDIDDAYAIKALFRGEADEAAQKRAVRCIVEEICGTYEMSFDPSNERLSSFNEGKRHVGRVLVGIATINLGLVKKAEERINKRRRVING